MIINFEHKQAAHCENGVTSNILNYNGINLSEAMVFGIGSGLFYSYLPFVKVNNAPGFSYRTLPGWIFGRVAKRLGFSIVRKKYSDANKAMSELDNLLEMGKPVGLQVGVYHLTYFPDPYRFHFNAHNIVVYGKEDNEYLISDPVMERPTRLTDNELNRVRFAKGVFAPKGHLYYPTKLSNDYNLEKAVKKGINRTASDMLNNPLPLFGIRGIKTVSKVIRKMPEKLGNKKASLYLGQIVRMQEEIGTGGAGFRFIFAAFLQEAAEIVNKRSFIELSNEMTIIGDKWREFAVMASRNCKDRAKPEESYNSIADIVRDIADKEEILFKKLLKEIK